MNKSAKKENENDINEVLDELNPDYKNELIYRYLDEMPEEIVALMKNIEISILPKACIWNIWIKIKMKEKMGI